MHAWDRDVVLRVMTSWLNEVWHRTSCTRKPFFYAILITHCCHPVIGDHVVCSPVTLRLLRRLIALMPWVARKTRTARLRIHYSQVPLQYCIYLSRWSGTGSPSSLALGSGCPSPMCRFGRHSVQKRPSTWNITRVEVLVIYGFEWIVYPKFKHMIGKKCLVQRRNHCWHCNLDFRD